MNQDGPAIQQPSAFGEPAQGSVPPALPQARFGADRVMAFHWRPGTYHVSAYPWVGQGCSAVLGLDPEALVADPSLLWQCVDPDDRAPLKAAKLKARREHTVLRHRFRITTLQGERRWLELLGYPEPGSADGLWHCLAVDISEQQRRLDELLDLQQSQQQQQQRHHQQAHQLAEAHAALLRMSTTDMLTGLGNRLYFEHSLLRAVTLAQRLGRTLSLVRLNARGVRGLNARAGLLAGDQALQSLARLLSQRQRNDDIVARLGGVEFALLLPQTDQPSAHQLLAQLHDALLRDDSLVAAGIRMGWGVAECRDADSPDSLMVRAEAALRG